MHLLSAEELRRLYPESDGKPMAENTLQFEWIALIKLNLEACFVHQADVFIAADLFWYPVEGKSNIRFAPDVMVVIGRPKGHRGSYMQFVEENIPPQVVFEILSPGNTKAEMARKLKFYSLYGVKEYYVYDPDHNNLEIYTRTRNELRLRESVRKWSSPLLGIQFDWNEETLILHKPNGDRFLSFQELVDFHEQAIEDLRESRNLLQREQELLMLERSKSAHESQRAEQERKRAEREAHRAEQEAENAQQAAERANLAEQRMIASIQALAKVGIPVLEIAALLGLNEQDLAKYFDPKHP